MKILVTGASGFIGSAFVRLAAAGGHQVLALSRRQSSGPAVFGHWTHGSLKNPNWDEIRLFQPDACLHAAWSVGPSPNWDSVENESCLADSILFLSGLRDLGLRHTVVTGTCAEYAPGDTPNMESASPLAPSSLYARTKDLLRKWGEQNFTSAASSFCWARIFYAYGPGEPADRLASQVMVSLSQGARCTIRAPAAKKDYIFVEDVASALLLLTVGGQGGTFNVASGSSISVGDLARLIAEQFDSERLLDFPDPMAKDSLGDRIANVDRLRAAGFTPAWQVPDGIAALWRHIRQTGQ